MFGLAVRKVVLSMLTKLRRDSTLEMTLMVPIPLQYFEVATSVQDSSLLPHRKWHKCVGDCHLIACNGRDGQMLLRVKVEKKIRHYTLSSQEWINVLYVTPSSEDSPLGLIDHHSRFSLGSTDTGGNIDRKVSAAEGIPDILHWRLDVSRWI